MSPPRKMPVQTMSTKCTNHATRPKPIPAQASHDPAHINYLSSLLGTLNSIMHDLNTGATSGRCTQQRTPSVITHAALTCQ
eukprot:1152178-Pelagomonas_calceolata.AAC.2